jgi:hypothetical protein
MDRGGVAQASLRVFISYSSRDRGDALWLKELVEAAGHRVWLDVFDLRPAARLAAGLESGVRDADVLCVLLSPAAMASRWVAEEIAHARVSGVRSRPETVVS